MRKYQGKNPSLYYKFRRVGKRRIKLQFKRWKKYSWNDQERIIRKYNVILLGHRTTKEKLKALFKKSKKGKERREKIKNGYKKFNRVIDTIISGLNKFSNETNKIHLDYDAGDRRMNRITQGLNRASGVDHDYSVLTGKRGNNSL